MHQKRINKKNIDDCIAPHIENTNNLLLHDQLYEYLLSMINQDEEDLQVIEQIKNNTYNHN